MTSGASAIVAGAVLSIQGMAAASGARFNVRAMRAVVTDPTYCTASSSLKDMIGTMPDLEKVVRGLAGIPRVL